MLIYTLREMRKKRCRTQKGVAKNLGITATYLSLLEKGKKNPSDELKKKIAKEYQVNVADIYKAIEKQESIKKGRIIE